MLTVEERPFFRVVPRSMQEMNPELGDLAPEARQEVSPARERWEM